MKIVQYSIWNFTKMAALPFNSRPGSLRLSIPSYQFHVNCCETCNMERLCPVVVIFKWGPCWTHLQAKILNGYCDWMWRVARRDHGGTTVPAVVTSILYITQKIGLLPILLSGYLLHVKYLNTIQYYSFPSAFLHAIGWIWKGPQPTAR